jgi:hypothetical protein
MMNATRKVLTLTGSILVAMLMSGCKETPPTSLYVEKPSSAPTISAVVPRDSALAGVTIVTLTGTGFSPNKTENVVYFNASPGEIQQASATQLVVKTPILVSDTVSLKVAVVGHDLFSNAIAYKLKPAVVEFGVIPNTVEEPVGMTADALGNLYVSFLNNLGVGIGVKKITPAGVRTDYAPAFSTAINKWIGMKYGRDGGIYTTANRNAVFRIVPNGGSSAPWTSVGGAGVSFAYDLDYDQAGNIWTAGDNSVLARIAPDRTVKGFPFTGDVRSVRVFDGRLYLATRNDTIWNIWRSLIVSADSLAPRELYFNFSTNYPSAGAYAITFASDGDMFVGTDSSAGTIVVVHPNKTHEKLYPGLLKDRCVAFAYGIGTEMYFSRTGLTDASKKVIRVNTQKTSAPYYGRQ